VHIEACRWEHVMSEHVERRLVVLLNHPTYSPYGNPIPGLDQLGVEHDEVVESHADLMTAEDAGQSAGKYQVRRIIEPIQNSPELMERLHRGGIKPGAVLEFGIRNNMLTVQDGPHTTELPLDVARGIQVRVPAGV
jgi:DtxR family Mn-dependent transcriptional regulator